ncbi:MAG: hypothetical protein ACM3Q1_09635 [Bacteroidales bacterium]
MARTISMAPHAPRPATAKTPAGKTSAGSSPAAAHAHGGVGGHHSHHVHPARRGGIGGWATATVVALAALGAALWFWLGGAPTADPGSQLLTQMEAAARGEITPTHAFGGALSVSQANGRINVIAEGVPSRACVQVGWRLARTGTIIVNGTLPTRLSAARLSDLCSGDDATLMWVPDQ